ncbi:MAG: histidine kinase [Oscillospiraceae bacterium]|jgi:two-component system sensor histidine kinase YesM|nr:histidine kinase [Oscillospiraceae bacterium]
MPGKRKLSYAQSIMLLALLSVIPLYLFFIMVYQDAYQTILADRLTSISLEGDKIMSDIDAELSNLLMRQKEYLALQCVRRVTLEDSRIYTNYEIISAKQEVAEMSTVVLLNSRILDAFDIYFPRTGSMYTSGGGWRTFGAPDRAYVRALVRAREGCLIRYQDEYLLYHTNRRAFAPAGSDADVVMVMRVSKPKLVAMFAARLPNALCNLFLLQKDHGEVIASTHPDMATEVAALHGEPGALEAARAVALGGAPHYVTITDSQMDDLALYYIVAQGAVTSSLQRFVAYFIASLALLAAVLLILFLQSYFFLYRPVYKLLHGFGRVQQGDLTARLGRARTKEFDTLNQGFNTMADSLRQLIDQRYTLRLLAREAELKQLYAQINPHFLYNCFFTIQTMLEEENYDCCNDLAHLLGVYLQYLTASPQGTAKLSEEVRHAEAYARIQSMRFGTRAVFRMDALPEGWTDARTPRLVLQPLLENAFEHGIKPRKEGGVILLRFRQIAADTKRLLISVENSGNGIAPEALDRIRRHAVSEPMDTQGVALYNISKRLLLTDPESCLCFAQSDLGGLCVSLTLRWML